MLPELVVEKQASAAIRPTNAGCDVSTPVSRMATACPAPVLPPAAASATELSDSQVNEIEKALKSRLGRNVNLSTETDANLIGGAVIRAGDVVIDGSVRARLEGLSNALVA